MRNFRLLHAGLDVAPILAELDAAPEWGQYDERREREGTAHGDLTADLWIRYFARDTLNEPADYNRPGQCVFYPVWDRLPSIHRLVWGLMTSQRAVEIGGILCTRLPPGGRIERHADDAWHAHRYNRKCYVVLEANARCIVECDGDEQVFRQGEIFEFDNTRPHAMTNDGNDMRTILIICLRCEE
jgi:mannose-6-phosphate isomerase-like protein (cupin superfamily)